MKMRDKHLKAATSAQPPACRACGGSNVEPWTEIEEFPYGAPPDTVILKADVPGVYCRDCDVVFSGEEGETIRHEAVCRHLGVMTPDEVQAVRKQYGLSRKAFAEITGIGEASLARWEGALLIQNTANDQLLYLLLEPANMERLKSRNRKAPPAELADTNVVQISERRKFRTLAQQDEQRLREEAQVFQLRAKTG